MLRSLNMQAKSLGNDIAEKQRAAEVTEAAIDQARVAYAPCGDYTSTLFFAISGGLGLLSFPAIWHVEHGHADIMGSNRSHTNNHVHPTNISRL
jgi:hypothetical protein